MNKDKYYHEICDYVYKFQVAMTDEAKYSDFEINGLLKALEDDFLKRYNSIGDKKINSSDINRLLDSLSEDDKYGINAKVRQDIKDNTAPTFWKMGTHWTV